MIKTKKKPRQHAGPTTELLTVPDVARRLNLSDKTVRRMIQAGELEAYQIRRQWRISERDLCAFLAQQRVR